MANFSRRRAMLSGSALALVPFVSGCAGLTAAETTTIQTDLQTAITVGETVDGLLSVLGVTAPACALAAAALVAAQAALTEWKSAPSDGLALAVLSNVGTIYGYLPTADQTAVAKIQADIDLAQTTLTDPNVVALAADIVAVLPDVQSQAKAATAARAFALKEVK